MYIYIYAYKYIYIYIYIYIYTCIISIYWMIIHVLVDEGILYHKMKLYIGDSKVSSQNGGIPFSFSIRRP